MNKQLLTGLSLLGAVAFSIDDAQAVSFRLPNQDPEAIARGNAFTATADNPSAIYHNPAGITQLEGHNVSVGIYAVSANTKYMGGGVTMRTDTSLQPVPQIHYVFSPENSALSYGLGIYAPYGLSLDWGRNAPFRFLGERGKVAYVSVNPVIAYQPCNEFSIGIGPTINYSKASLRQSIGPNPFGFNQFQFDGDGLDFGFNAGIMIKPHEKWSIGVNYRYTTEIEYEGKSQLWPTAPRTVTTGELTFPQFVAVGVSYRPTENWNFEIGFDWTDWDNVNSVTFNGVFGGPVSLAFNHESAFMYNFGVTRKLPNGYWVSAGYFFSENSVPDATFNPLIPDSDLHLGSVGFGHKGEKWDWAIAYHFATNGGGRVVSGSPAGGLADGRYESFNQAINASVTFRF